MYFIVVDIILPSCAPFSLTVLSAVVVLHGSFI